MFHLATCGIPIPHHILWMFEGLSIKIRTMCHLWILQSGPLGPLLVQILFQVNGLPHLCVGKSSAVWLSSYTIHKSGIGNCPYLILGHTLRAKTGQFKRRSQVCQLKRQSAMNNEKDHCLYCFYYFYFYNNSEAGE